jgi:non-canonical poly(A) RNA polymerase PAPD5/7
MAEACEQPSVNPVELPSIDPAEQASASLDVSQADDGDSNKNLSNQSLSGEVDTPIESDQTPSASKSFRALVAEASKKKVERKLKLEQGIDFLSFAEDVKVPEQKKAKHTHVPTSAVTPCEDIDHRSPWARGRKYISKCRDRTVILHEEILDFVDFISPTAAENKRRSFLLLHFQEITKKLWPNASLHVFGSYATGLHLPSSDIDCVVLDCDDPNALQAMAKVIRADGGFERIQVIGKAKVPIIKFEDAETGIPMNICFGQADGLANTDLVRKYLEQMPALRPLVLVLKQFLYNRDLHETFTGGMGSYLLTMTVVSHLQHHPGRGPTYSEPERNLGALLIDYLHLYGLRFNMGAVGISVRGEGAYFEKRRRPGWAPAGKEHLLCVEDPNRPDSDLGRNSFNVRSAQRAFEHAYYALAVPPPPGAAEDEETLLGRILKWDQRWDSALAIHRLARFKRTAPAAAASGGGGGGGGGGGVKAKRGKASSRPGKSGGGGGGGKHGKSSHGKSPRGKQSKSSHGKPPRGKASGLRRLPGSDKKRR